VCYLYALNPRNCIGVVSRVLYVVGHLLPHE
jgi:hypothetical protein